MKKIILFLFISFNTHFLFADVLIEGELNRGFKISNIDEFKNYEFFYEYQTFYYNEGHKRGKTIRTVIKNNQIYFGSDRFDDVCIKLKDKRSDEIVSCLIKAGGVAHANSKSNIAITDVFEIKEEKNGQIFLEKTNEEFKYDNGKIEIIKMGFGFAELNQKNILLFVGIPFLSLLLLIVLRKFRKQQ